MADTCCTLVPYFKVHAGRLDDFKRLCAEFEERTRNEPGCLHYTLHRNANDPNTFYVTEIYENQAALDAHMGSDAFAAFGASLGDFVENADLQFAAPIKAAKS